MTWCEAIEHGKLWSQAADTPRFRFAFTTIAATFNQWPTPNQFLEAMPPRLELKQEPMQLIESDEQKAENARLAEESKARVHAMIQGIANGLKIELKSGERRRG